MLKDIAAIEQEIIEEFEIFEDSMEKYEYLIEVGTLAPTMDAIYQVDDYLVKGCQSKVWLRGYMKNDRLFFDADSNTVITKGIISLLVRVFSGQLPNDIIAANLDFIEAIQLHSHLSSLRSNGLTAMIQRMKALAKANAPSGS